MNGSIFSSDAYTLSKIFGPQCHWTCILDPFARLTKNDDSNLIIARRPKELSEWMEQNEQTGQSYLLIDLGDEPSLEIYCRKDVPSILHFPQGRKYAAPGHRFRILGRSDGSFQYIYSADNQYPSFLNVADPQQERTDLFKRYARLMFRLRLGQWVGQREFYFMHKEVHPIEALLSEIPYDQYSIFMGLPGPDRKAIVEVSFRNHTSHYLKIPVRKGAMARLQQEHETIRQLHELGLEKSQVPRSYFLEDRLLVSQTHPQEAKPADTFGMTHLETLDELYQKTLTAARLENLSLMVDIRQQISRLSQVKWVGNGIDPVQAKDMIRMLQQVCDDLPAQAKLSVAMAHSDFSPWNMYEKDGRLFLYDFELSKMQMPLFFDLFHYVFQSNSETGHKNLNDIEQELQRIGQHVFFQSMVRKYNIDLHLNFRLFLLYTISFHLLRYSRQQNLPLQAHSRINLWYSTLHRYAEQPLDRFLIPLNK